MRARFINPFTDFGFKKLFGEEVNKDLLIDFLNGLLPDYHKIKDLQYKKTDQLGDLIVDRKAVFDIYCQSENGDYFIVELQKAKQNFFKERSIFYSTFPIREQAEKGKWDFNLKAVYCVGILDFIFEETKNEHNYLHTIKLKNDSNRVFYDKLTFVYVEMPKFNKTEEDLENEFDKWLFFIKNLEDLDKIPNRLQTKIFEKAFNTAEIAQFIPAQMEAYEDSLKYYRDMNNVIETREQEGISKEKKRTMLACFKEGLSIPLISKITLSLENEVIEYLKSEGLMQ
jgi:predicted transposase/invertase (TIGR01784 family)